MNERFQKENIQVGREVKSKKDQTALKKTKTIDLLSAGDMLLMTKKGIRRGRCHSIYRYAKANNKHIK